MKVREGNYGVRIKEPIGLLDNMLVTTVDEQFWQGLQEIPEYRMHKLHKEHPDKRGMPRYVAITARALGYTEFTLFPVADQDYNVKIRFYPPMKEV